MKIFFIEVQKKMNLEADLSIFNKNKINKKQNRRGVRASLKVKP